MKEKIIKKSFGTIRKELERELMGKEQGYVLSVPVGEDIFPFSKPPVLQIILLDQDDMTVAFLPVSASDARSHRKGQWMVGGIDEAAEKLFAWIDRMISVRFDIASCEIQEI